MVRNVAVMLALLGAGPLPAALAGDVDMFVARYRTDEVFRFDGRTGERLGVFAALENIATGCVGPDGLLYFIQYGRNSRIWKFDGGEGVLVREALLYATALCLTPDGNLLVCHDSGTIIKLDRNTGRGIDTFEPAPRAIGNLTFGPDGKLYATDPLYDRIFHWDGHTGAFLGEFTRGGGLDAPGTLAFGPDGHLYVASANRVLRYDSLTKQLLGVFIDGRRAGINVGPSIAFGPDANLYVASTPGVWRFNGASGQLIDRFTHLKYPGQILFRPPDGVECDRIKRFRTRCKNGLLTCIIRSDLPEGTRVHVRNNDETSFARVDARGRGKVRFENQTNEPHNVSIPWCRGIACPLLRCEGDKCRD
ncbi:MAG: hypothetical protein C4547_15125 [Phycisphaerales bacterium]|nr:MAG: hypothetical protein C4547_15125 [Phycisphaerales bacterium]